jgi:hypothetical protein
MPVQAGKPHAVAKRTADGKLLLASHTVDVKGDWAMVNVMTDVPEVRLEYYVDLAISDPVRRYIFEWPGGLEVEQVTYQVMQPIGAKDLSVNPPGRESVGNDGFTYYLSDLGSKARSETFSIEVTYTKTTPTLTALALQGSARPVGQAPPAGSATRSTPSGSGGASMWLVPLVLILLIAALTGIWIFMRARGQV